MIIYPMEELYLLVKNNFYIILAILLTGLVTRFLTKKEKISSHGIPGSLGLPLVGESFSFISAAESIKGSYDFVRTYGKWFKTSLFGKVHVFVPTIAGAKTVLPNDFKWFNKGYVKSIDNALGKNSLFCVPFEDHKRIRRLLSGAFSMDSMAKFVQKFDKLLTAKFKKLADDGKSFVVLDFNMKITFDAMCDMLMSITEESLLDQLENYCATISNAMLSFPHMIPGTRYYKGIKAREKLMTFLDKMIASRRSSKEPQDDFLQSMLDRDSFSDDEKLTDSEIRDNLLVMIIADQGITAAGLMWSVKFLDENKEVQNTLREEQLSILRSKPRGALLCLEDLNKMSYGLKVLNETLRMANVVLWFPRVALVDCNIQDFAIKKGWHVNVDVTYIHYDPEIYKDPLQFNPSRFDEAPQKPCSYIPFGARPRTSLGINMAKMAMLVFLRRLTSGYNWTVDDQDPTLDTVSVIHRLKSGLQITLTAIKDEI
ncbi:abscisic acid 8'-hydroxylase 3-like [Bidens hawaiensis]|uniref:abscisic acid 8'-hydroxylase 3-like n=1 Tax=Bidens hawaiensis TaxID=980011 RepID=UPI00404B1D4F